MRSHIFRRRSIRIVSAALAMLTTCSTLSSQDRIEDRQQQLARWLQRYPEADVNGDGKLTEDEARQYRQQLRERQGARAKQPQRPKAPRLAPNHANVKYGEHARNVFDVWLPPQAKGGAKGGAEGGAKGGAEGGAKGGAEGGAPVLIYFHGGGFVAGDKSGFDPTAFLADGIAVVSANYRFVDGQTTLSPAPMHDAARVVQTVKHHAKRWSLDPNRIAVSGNSAGAVIAMWLGYHDDLAQPQGDDPIARQSTRVACVAPLNGPSNLDPRWITRTMGGPLHVHGSFPKMFGVSAQEAPSHPNFKLVLESSPIEHVSAGDAPTLLIYNGKLEGIPLPADTSTGVLIHHAFFGKALKVRLDAVGVKCEFHHSFDARKDGYAKVRQWLKANGLGKDS